MKALLVDDSKAARFAMGKLLKDQGLEVEMAASGEEALDKIATEPINIVFMDQSMPGMGGIAATRAITSNEKTAHIPVVLCTGNEGEKLEQMASEAGAIGVLTKPPREEQLKQMLSSIQVESVVPAVEEVASPEEPAEAATVDQDAIMAEVEKRIRAMRRQMEEMDKALQARVDKVANATEQRLKPIQTVLEQLDDRVSAKVKEQMKVDASNQRIQLEALRQQVNAGLDEMEEREERLRTLVVREAQEQILKLVDRKLALVKENLAESREDAATRIAALEARIDGMGKGLLMKSAIIAVLSAGAAFAAAFFLLG
jgi:CheY-like chemotaxis protein